MTEEDAKFNKATHHHVVVLSSSHPPLLKRLQKKKIPGTMPGMAKIIYTYSILISIYNNFHFVFCLRTYILFYIYIRIIIKDTQHLIETLYFCKHNPSI